MKQSGARKPKKSVHWDSTEYTVRFVPKAAVEDKSRLWFQPDIGTKKPVAWKLGTLDKPSLKDYSTLWKGCLRDDGTTYCAFRLPNMLNRFCSVQAYYKEQAGDFRSVIDSDYPEVRQTPMRGFYGKRINEGEWNGMLLKHSGKLLMPTEAFGRCKYTSNHYWHYRSEAFQTFNQPCQRPGGCRDYVNFYRAEDRNFEDCGCEDRWFVREMISKGRKVSSMRTSETEDPKLPLLSSMKLYTANPNNAYERVLVKSVASESDRSSMFSDDTRERAAPHVLAWVSEQIKRHEGEWLG
jgi:hypothetical protein